MERVENPKSRFPTLPTALGNPQEQRIPTFTTATAAAMVPGAAVYTQPHSNNNIPRWAGINRRNGPTEVAKLTVPFLQRHTLLMCVVILLLITTVNLRGVRETGAVFAFPSYLPPVYGRGQGFVINSVTSDYSKLTATSNFDHTSEPYRTDTKLPQG